MSRKRVLTPWLGKAALLAAACVLACARTQANSDAKGGADEGKLPPAHAGAHEAAAAQVAESSAPSPNARDAQGILFRRIAAFRDYADSWRRALEAGQREPHSESLREPLDSLRRAYKRFELAVETLHPLTKETFNGPPFALLDRKVFHKVEVESPVGLQMLEEEVYRSSPPRDSLLRRLAGLRGEADRLASLLKHHPPDDAQLWEAMENEVVRVLTLGLAGFDSPASGLGLVESGVALESLLEFARLYRKNLDARQPALYAELEGRLRTASRRLLAAGDFDAFDRLAFLREAGNPLFAAFVDARMTLGLGRSGSLSGVPRVDRAFPIPQRAVNPRARGLFDPAFLDPGFYALDHRGRPRRRSSPRAVDLGRDLFFDPVLSGDLRRACASCHQPEKGFAEPRAKSLGFGFTGSAAKDSMAAMHTAMRNAPALHYAAYQRFQFWDLRAVLLEEQIGHVVQGTEEFNTTFQSLLSKLRGSPEYAQAFARAFPEEPSDPVNPVTLTSALAQYLRSLPSFNSPWDRYVRGESDTLSPAARRGFNLFMGKAGCGTCHFPPVFNGTVPPLYRETESEVLGVPAADDTLNPELDADPGRHATRPDWVWERERSKGHSGFELWLGAFKTPTVRNVALTAPYMHNGALPTLESVVRFYDVGGGAGMGLDIPHQTLPPDSLGLTREEKEDLVAFMRSLTDDPPRMDKPARLPAIPGLSAQNSRRIGGEY